MSKRNNSKWIKGLTTTRFANDLSNANLLLHELDKELKAIQAKQKAAAEAEQLQLIEEERQAKLKMIEAENQTKLMWKN